MFRGTLLVSTGSGLQQGQVPQNFVILVFSIRSANCPSGVPTSVAQSIYMEYYGDLVRHSIRNYCTYEVGTKFDDRDKKFDEIGPTYNPEVLKYRRFPSNTPTVFI